MDYFNGITNEEFIKDFLAELYSVTEFKHQVDEDYEIVKENDGDLDVDPDSVYGKHIMQIQSNMCNKLIELLNKHNLSNYEIERIYNEKRMELFTLSPPLIDEYELKIKVWND